jgi:hypothetical protein
MREPTCLNCEMVIPSVEDFCSETCRAEYNLRHRRAEKTGVIASTEPPALPSDEQREAKALDWLIHGGNGHEDGKDGLRALMLPGNSLPEYLGAYEEYLDEARQAAASQPARSANPLVERAIRILRNEVIDRNANPEDYDSNITEVITTICDFAAAALAHPERKEADELRMRIHKLADRYKRQARADCDPANGVSSLHARGRLEAEFSAALEAALGDCEKGEQITL